MRVEERKEEEEEMIMRDLEEDSEKEKGVRW